MNDPVKTEKCDNCKLEILSSNYIVHCLHCVKNIYLCDKCGQPVNYNRKIDHDQTNHDFVNCFNCNVQLEKYLLRDHVKNICPCRKVNCSICDIEIIASDLSEHENYCGSRTEKCSECGEFVMLKYRSLHIDSNHGFIKLSDEPGPSPSWQNGKRTLYNFMPDLSSKTFKSFMDHERKSSELSDRSGNLGVDEWPALTSFRSLQISEGKENEPTKPKASNSSQTEDSDLLYAIQVSRELNSDIWFKDLNIKDQALKNSFTLVTESHLSGEKVIQKNMFDKNSKKKEKAALEFNINGNNLNIFYGEKESTNLPCEFCGSLIIANELILHQSRCGLNVTEPINRRNRRHKMPYFDENDEDSWEKKISCTICNKVFKSSLLESHELHCKKNSTRPGKSQNKGSRSKNIRSINVKSPPGIQNGLETNSAKPSKEGAYSECLSKYSNTTEGKKDLKYNLSCSEAGGSKKPVKASRKSRRAPSPPRR